jgi:hypothetical protein
VDGSAFLLSRIHRGRLGPEPSHGLVISQTPCHFRPTLTFVRRTGNKTACIAEKFNSPNMSDIFLQKKIKKMTHSNRQGRYFLAPLHRESELAPGFCKLFGRTAVRFVSFALCSCGARGSRGPRLPWGARTRPFQLSGHRRPR